MKERNALNPSTDVFFHPKAIGNTHEIALSLVDDQLGKILDAAAGDLGVSQFLQKRGHEVVSADIHFDEKPLPNDCIELDLNEALPFVDNSFDGVVSIETIEHLENPWFFLREVSRVLKPGGYVIITTPNVSTVFSRLLNVVTGKLLWFQQRDLSPLGHITPIHWHLLLQMAGKAGLRLEKRRYSWARIPLANVTIRSDHPLLGECVVARFRKS